MKRRGLLILTALIVIGLAMFLATCSGGGGDDDDDDTGPPPGWTIQTVDSDGDVGDYTSIALDSNDKVHISYFECGKLTDDNDCTKGDLKYATNAKE